MKHGRDVNHTVSIVEGDDLPGFKVQGENSNSAHCSGRNDFFFSTVQNKPTTAHYLGLLGPLVCSISYYLGRPVSPTARPVLPGSPLCAAAGVRADVAAPSPPVPAATR